MTLVMGILNVTPDSFSDGGRWETTAAALSHAREMLDQGAEIIDVGGESTRPGAARVPEGEEMARVVPVVEALAGHGATVSVDTMRANVARAAIEAGAAIVNDVSGGQADPGMFDVVATTGAQMVIMHWRAHSATMQDETRYDDVVADVMAELRIQRDAALTHGISPERIILDPGIGFSKTFQHNWLLLRHLDRLQALGHRLLVGVSRKGFLGEALEARPADGRDVATAAVTAWCAARGVWAVRTHEVPMQVDAAVVGARIHSDQGHDPHSGGSVVVG